MSELPPYSGPLALCIKCGTRDASTAYRLLRQGDQLPPHEYHQRICKRCGFIWNEAVLDEQG